MALHIPIIGELVKSFNDELPTELGDMDNHLDYILRHVMPFSEDLREGHFWLGKRWKEVRDDAGFHESILHIFSGESEYLKSVDGNISRGAWRMLGGSNSLILEMGGVSELYDLAFLNDHFFILKKHGDQTRKGKNKYRLFSFEATTRGLDWRQLMELLYNVYRSDSGRFSSWFFFILIVVAIILVLSLG